MTTSTSTAMQAAPPLSPAETRLRAVEVARLKHAASITGDAGHVRYLTRRAKQVSDAMPICCYIEKQRNLRDREHGASSRIELDSDGQAVSEAAVYRGLRYELAEQHRYPGDLQADVDAAFLGRDASDDAYAIVQHHRARHG